MVESHKIAHCDCNAVNQAVIIADALFKQGRRAGTELLVVLAHPTPERRGPEGRVVFDPKTDRHHHFIDEATGAIHDVAWESVDVRRVADLKGLDVREYQVVMKGRRKR